MGQDTLPRRTVARSVAVSGVGIHTGAKSVTTLEPATTPGAGVVFRVGGQEIPASVSNVVDTARCTVLGAAGVTVSTVEHLLAALAGAGVTDCVVAVTGPELPIGDGSALLWSDAIASAGVTVVAGSIERLRVEEPMLVMGSNGSFVTAFPSPEFRCTAAIVFEHALVGTQAARYEPANGDLFARDVAPARTFGFVEEVEALRVAGLALGGSLENALIVYPDRYSRPLRFGDELARHKLLDLIGDLALTGRPLQADVIAVKPSHRLNTEFARALVERYGNA